MSSAATTGREETDSSTEVPAGRTHGYEYYRAALADEELPCAFVDLDRIAANADAIEARASGTQVRIASKSVRSRPVLERILEESDTFEGIMCYSGREAAYLAAFGFEDLLVAYPVYQESDIVGIRDALEAGATVTTMVDSVEHVRRLSKLGEEFDTTFPLCLDIDLSTKHFGLHFGVRRSGIRDADAALDLCDRITELPAVTVAGMMGYEAQLAGIPDRAPSNNRLKNAAIRALKRRSRKLVRRRRADVVEAVEAAGYDLDLVNGGGTATVEFTIQDPTVTEVTVGSGFYSPALFDHYDRFEHDPAAGFALEVTRNSDPGIYTCRGGGYLASGPPDEDREPAPWFPTGMELRGEEGAGEVQTPVLYDGDLGMGEPVFFRHAKAGELCEQFESLHLLRDGTVVETVPTYRGDGRCFL